MTTSISNKAQKNMGIWTRILKEHLINKEKKFKYFWGNIHEKKLKTY